MAKRKEPIGAADQLSNLFGSYRAEWLRERLFELYTEPSYFPELVTPRPCVLIGGRGTGKTTVLRGMSFEGQFALAGKKASSIPLWQYYGLYYRVNTNRVTAFRGPELESADWIRLFGHYIGLIICDQAFKFLDWYERHAGTAAYPDSRSCQQISTTLCLRDCESPRELAAEIESALFSFEAYINNVADRTIMPVSMLGASIDCMFAALSRIHAFTDKQFYILIDEYENFDDYQQQVVNTLIKHSGPNYTFKIGVRELGWRRRVTLNDSEQLISPADYVRVSIEEQLEGERFRDFALNVCNSRIRRVRVGRKRVFSDIRTILPALTEEEEALLLGVDELASTVRATLSKTLESDKTEVLDSTPDFKVYFLDYWSKSTDVPVDKVAIDYLENRSEWDTRFENYKYVSLYTIRRGRRGIRKYYCGWPLFTQLAGCNIRYLLELVDKSLVLHLRRGGQLSAAVAPDVQTEAARGVGRKNLSELEGLSVHGAQLTKLLLGLGRVFQVMAATPHGHTPEVNHFHLREAAKSSSGAGAALEVEVDNLLRMAVMHLALVRSPGTKLVDSSDTREYDYTAHPIYCAFFEFSHRRKRKLMLRGEQLLGLVKHPAETIKQILAEQNRSDSDTTDLPEQLALFESYYGTVS